MYIVFLFTMIAIPLAIIYKFGNDFKKLSYYAIFLLVFTAIFGLPNYFAYKILKCLIFIFSLYGGYTHYKYESKITAIAYALIALLFIGNFGFTRSDWETIDFLVAIAFYVGSWWYDKYLVVIAKIKHNDDIKIPIEFDTPLRRYLEFKIQTSLNSDNREAKFKAILYCPIACFGIHNVPKSEEVNSDIILIKIASAYYNILLAYALKRNYKNIIPDIRQSCIDFNTAASYARKMTYQEIVDLQDPMFTDLSGWLYPDIEDIIDIIAMDVFDCDMDDQNIDSSIQQTMIDIEYAVKRWGNCYLPNIFKTIDRYAQTKQ